MPSINAEGRKEGRKEDYTSLQPPRADWMDWKHPNNQNNSSQNEGISTCSRDDDCPFRLPRKAAPAGRDDE